MSRVLMLSWEYPPLLVGGLGRHAPATALSVLAGHRLPAPAAATGARR